MAANRFVSGLNLAGLSVGMASFLLIAQLVRFEWSYDRQSPHAGQIWRAFNETVADAGAAATQDANTHSALGPALKSDLPGEVVDYARLYNRGEGRVEFMRGQRPVALTGVWMTDPGFLRLFPQRFLAGDAASCLAAPFSLVLTRRAAERLFGGVAEALGQQVQAPGGPFVGLWQVTGVVADPPVNTHLKFEALGSYATRYAQGHEDNWDSYWDYNYFQLAPGAAPERVSRQLAAYSRNFLASAGIRFNMQPLTDIHLHSNLTYEIEPNGSARNVRFLALAGILLLLIAFVNYVNLSTARLLHRAREVGVRRAVGASRGQLFGQFLVEGALLNLVAVGLAVGLAQALMPSFSAWLGRPLHELPGYDELFWALCAGLWISGLGLACLWPAIAQSRLSAALMGKADFFRRRERPVLRHGLVVFQFACSTALIGVVLVVQRQLNFMERHEKGISLTRVAVLPAPNFDWRQDSLNRRKMAAFRQEITALSGVERAAVSDAAPALGITTLAGTSTQVYWAERPGSGTGQSTLYFFNAEKDFFATYGARLLAGELFVAQDDRAVFQQVVINETCRKMLGFPSAEAAIDEEIVMAGSENQRVRVKGVVADFHLESLKAPVRATFYYLHPQLTGGFISIKLTGGSPAATLAAVEERWRRFFPETGFSPVFADAAFAAQYLAERRLAQAFGLFAGLAVFVACLGLLGLAAYTAERRTKEIGIRKVLGASVAGIAGLLAKDFLKLVLVAIVLASPVAYYAMQQWLADFAYRITLQWWMFAAAGLLAVGIALLAVGAQSLRAALADPVKSLRNE
jgi:putative ABC transport system permease protein